MYNETIFVAVFFPLSTFFFFSPFPLWAIVIHEGLVQLVNQAQKERNLAHQTLDA